MDASGRASVKPSGQSGSRSAPRVAAMRVRSRPSVLTGSPFCRVLTISVGLALIAGCALDKRSLVEAPSTPPNIAAFVTGEAAASVNETGHFDLALAQAPHDIPIITPERARMLAVAEMKTFGQFFRAGYERAHGAPIDVDRLEADFTVLFVQTPYGRFPDGYAPTFGQLFGPYYLVTFRARGVPVVTSAVSAYTTGLVVDEEGKLRGMPNAGGSEFVTRGIPLDTTHSNPPPRIGPEHAVELVGRRTGARTIRTPRLVPVRYAGDAALSSPTNALWELALDREVAVRTVKGARRVQSRVLFVRGDRRLFVPTEVQPTEFQLHALPIGADRRTTGRAQPVTLPIEAGQPTVFEEVVVE